MLVIALASILLETLHKLAQFAIDILLDLVQIRLLLLLIALILRAGVQLGSRQVALHVGVQVQDEVASRWGVGADGQSLDLPVHGCYLGDDFVQLPVNQSKSEVKVLLSDSRVDTRRDQLAVSQRALQHLLQNIFDLWLVLLLGLLSQSVPDIDQLAHILAGEFREVPLVRVPAYQLHQISIAAHAQELLGQHGVTVPLLQLLHEA